MNERQTKLLAACPAKYRQKLERVYAKEVGYRQAVHVFCVHCVGYEYAEAANCTSTGCPLWNYRPGQASPFSRPARDGRGQNEQETISEATDDE